MNLPSRICSGSATTRNSMPIPCDPHQRTAAFSICRGAASPGMCKSKVTCIPVNGVIMLSTRQPFADRSRMEPLCRNWSRWTSVLGRLTRKRRCLRVTTPGFPFTYTAAAAGSPSDTERAARVSTPCPQLSARTQCSHPAHTQRPDRHDLATSHSQVVYDSHASQSPANRPTAVLQSIVHTRADSY